MKRDKPKEHKPENTEDLWQRAFGDMCAGLDKFGPDEILLVDQMVEPVIMGSEGVLRTGTVMLRKAQL